MKAKSHRKVKRTHVKTILRLPDIDIAKAAVINSLSCPDAQRGYRHAIDEFVDWYCSEPRRNFPNRSSLFEASHYDGPCRCGLTDATAAWPSDLHVNERSRPMTEHRFRARTRFCSSLWMAGHVPRR